MKKNKKINGKLIFIDTNNFISCIFEEVKELDLEILNEVKNQMDNNLITLITPENIVAEIENLLKKEFILVRDCINKNFKITQKNEQREKILNKIQKDSRLKAIKDTEKIEKKSDDLLKDILTHKNSIILEISQTILFDGLKRSILFKAPNVYKSANTHNKDDRQFTKDLDGIAFEAIKKFINSSRINKNKELIFCTNDVDYYETDEKKKLHPDILNDLKKIKSIVVYNNPLLMLEGEFGKKYSSAEVEKYKVAEPWSISASSMSGLANTSLNRVTLASELTTPSLNNDDYLGKQIFSADTLNTLPNLNNDIIRFCSYCGANITSQINNITSLNKEYRPFSEILPSVNILNYITCNNCGHILNNIYINNN